jgi:hypothetical protein
MMNFPRKELPTLVGANGATVEIDDLVIYCQRLQALVDAAFSALDGEDLTPQGKNALRLLGLTCDLMEPMIDHLDALPRWSDARQRDKAA